ncbi:MAG: radical SAM protein [Phycisphaerae bacterium]|nr:radical SAM protein [Phycisphaerae bacterium]
MTVKDSGRLERAHGLLAPCRVCPRRCEVDRLEGQLGFCGVGADPLVSSSGPHFGEETCLVGRGGSGTIFLAGCNLGCVFCQNYDISHERHGVEMPAERIVDLMLRLERHGCENVNFVSPTHVGPQLLEAIIGARRAGLTVPIVWNCGGYESIEMLELLAGWVQIYMPDLKYADDAIAERFSAAKDYWRVVRAAVKEMHRQVGDLTTDNGVATRGLLVRHLVLPSGLSGSEAVIDFLADEVSPDTFINVMGQYRPEYQARRHPELTRCPTADEIDRARKHAQRRGLRLAG